MAVAALRSWRLHAPHAIARSPQGGWRGHRHPGGKGHDRCCAATAAVAHCGPRPGHAGPSSVIGEAGRQLRAPWAASVAGLLFALLFTGALVLLRSQPMLDRDGRRDGPGVRDGTGPRERHRRAVPDAVRRDHVPVVHRCHPGPDRGARGPLLRDRLLRQRTALRGHPVRRHRCRELAGRWASATLARRHRRLARSMSPRRSRTRCCSPSRRGRQRSSCWPWPRSA